MLFVDLGRGKDGYFSDITRMLFLGEPSVDYLKVHQIVYKGLIAWLQTTRRGVLAKDFDAATRGVIEEAGYEEYFVHLLAHGLGSEVHEQTYLGATLNTVLKDGMVFSVEPGIYLPENFGVCQEEIIILRSGNPEILSDLPLI